jgi:5-hydroxyisourate hydrolase
MPGVSIHAVDVTRGVPAHGMRVEMFELAPSRRRIAEGWLSKAGMLEHAVATEQLRAGRYEVVFHVGEFFTAAGVTQSSPPFLTEVPFRFTIADPEQHYHLPLKLTPWGFSLFRGS